MPCYLHTFVIGFFLLIHLRINIIQFYCCFWFPVDFKLHYITDLVFLWWTNYQIAVKHYLDYGIKHLIPIRVLDVWLSALLPEINLIASHQFYGILFSSPLVWLTDYIIIFTDFSFAVMDTHATLDYFFFVWSKE